MIRTIPPSAFPGAVQQPDGTWRAACPCAACWCGKSPSARLKELPLHIDRGGMDAKCMALQLPRRTDHADALFARYGRDHEPRPMFLG